MIPASIFDNLASLHPPSKWNLTHHSKFSLVRVWAEQPFQKKQLQDNYLFKNDPTFLNNFVKEEVSGWELGVGEA